MDSPKRRDPRQSAKSPRAVTRNSGISIPPVHRVLDALDRVKETGPGTWLASCPTSAHQHGDRSRGLSIREGDDGRVLIHCHAGCAVDAVVAAIGLELSDLFPAREITYPHLAPKSGLIGRPRYRRIPWQDVFEALERQLWICSLAFSDLAAGKAFSPEDAQAIAKAAYDMATELSAIRSPDKKKPVYKDAADAMEGIRA